MHKESLPIGKSIRALRKRRNMTILSVCKATGIDIASLSRIETGKMTGTVESHMSIARCLGVDLPELYAEAFESVSASNTPPPSEPVVHSSSNDVSSELLSGGGSDRKLQPTRLHLKPGAQTHPETFPMGTERFLYVLKGKIIVVIKGVEYPVEENGSLCFYASSSHLFKNARRQPASAILVTCT